MAFLLAPVELSDLRDWLRKVSTIVNGIMRGRTNNTGSFTLTANTTSTTIVFPKDTIGNDSILLYVPTTANAATEFGAGSIYISSRDVTNQTMTMTHANTSATDKTFDYVVVG